MPFIPDEEQPIAMSERRGFIPDEGPAANRGFIPDEDPVTFREKLTSTSVLDVLAHLPFSPLHDYERKGAEEAKRQLRTGDFGQRQYAMGGHGFPAYRPARPAQSADVLRKIIADQEKQASRGETIPAAIAGGIADLPAFMGEMVAGGIGKVRSIRGAAAFAGKMTALQPHRIESAMINQIERGETGGMALAKAWGDVYIGNISETAGAGISKVMSKLPLGNKLVNGLRRFALKKGLVKSNPEFWKRISTTVGYHGLVEEWGEERLGTFLQGLVGTQDFGAGKDASADERIAAGLAQDFEVRNILIEAGVLLAPASAKQIGMRTTSRKQAELGVTEALVQIEPTTSDQAIGQQYGLTNEETDATLQYAEEQFRELKNKDNRSAKEKKELTFLKKERKNIESLLDDATSKKPLVPGLAQERITPATMVLGQLNTLPRTQPTEGERRRMSVLGQAITKTKKTVSNYILNQDRMLKLSEMLDGYEENGPVKRFIYHPIKNAAVRTRDNIDNAMQGFKDTLDDLDIDFGKMMTNQREDVVGGFKMTDTERIGVYMLAQNKKGRKRAESWFADETIDNAKAVDQIVESVETSDEEMAVVQLIQDYVDAMEPKFFAAAERMGLKDIKKEENYLMLLTEDQDEVTQPAVIEQLTQRISGRGTKTPGQRATKKRTGTAARAKIDVATILPEMVRAVERFTEVGPIAAKIGRSMDNPKFKLALNNATRGEGYKVVRSWLEDSVRGSTDREPGHFARWMKAWRRNASVYLLGFKVATVAPKQVISANNAIAKRPILAPGILKRMIKYGDLGALGNLAKDYAAVSKKSKMMEGRDWNRDLTRLYNKPEIKKFFAGKRLSPLAMAPVIYMDKATSTAVWSAAYERALVDLDGNEKAAIQYADDMVTQTQPMGNVEDLPGYFRGGTLDKMVTTFMNQPNQNWNFLRHDIYNALKAGKISKTVAMQRFIMGQIVPALILGTITRGRLPETPEEMALDVISYLTNPLVFFGRWVYNAAIGDWDPVDSALSTIPLKGFEETGRAVASLKRGNWQKAAERGAGAIGAFTGAPAQQIITTTGGIIDLAQGETDDYKRLIYSKYLIEKHHPDKPKTKNLRRRRTTHLRRKNRRTR